jgi:hypothetical protein
MVNYGPIIRTMPSVSPAPLSVLNKFPTFTREMLRAMGEPEQPAYNRSLQTKTWKDKTQDASDPSNVSVYKYIAGTDANGKGVIKQLVIPSSVAVSLNLPGLPHFPAYTIAPTKTTRGTDHGTPVPTSPEYLALPDDAKALMDEINAIMPGSCSNLYDQVDDPNNAEEPIIYAPDDKRRQLMFTFKGSHPVYVGLLLEKKYKKGIGYPFVWDLTGDEPNPVLQTLDDGSNDSRGPVPMPIFDLSPTEFLVIGGPLATLELENSALPHINAGPAQASGGFTDDDRRKLNAIYDKQVSGS